MATMITAVLLLITNLAAVDCSRPGLWTATRSYAVRTRVHRQPCLVAADDSGDEDAPSENVHQPTVRTQQKPDVSAAAAAALAACEWDEWGERETWALEDSVPRFSLEGGRIVLWRRMSLEVPELLQFTPAQLHARWLVQGGPAAAAVLRDFEPPPCLEDWTCIAPHRYEGALHNVPSMRDGTLRATVEHDVEAELTLLEEGDDAGATLGCSPEGLDGQRRWVRTRQGALFELGKPCSAALDAVGADAELADDAAAMASTAFAGASEKLGAVAAETVGAAVPVALAGGALLAASAAAWFFIGHHHVDVSVFIV